MGTGEGWERGCRSGSSRGKDEGQRQNRHKTTKDQSAGCSLPDGARNSPQGQHGAPSPKCHQAKGVSRRPPAAGRRNDAQLGSVFSRFNVFRRVKSLPSPFPQRDKNQLHSQKAMQLTCVNKPMAFKLMIAVYLSSFISSLYAFIP